MNKKYLFIIIIILVLALTTYYLLGGFKTPEFNTVDQPEINILGTYYEGTLGSDSLSELFMESRKMVEENTDISEIAIAYYGNVDEESGFVRNFIGVIVPENSTKTLKSNWEMRSFKATTSIKACIQANVLAMPTPNNMLADLRSYGEEENIKADTFFIEYYAGPNNLCVELFGK